MKSCQHCGTQLKDEAEFCFFCGHKQEVAVKAPENESQISPEPKKEPAPKKEPEPKKERAPKNARQTGDAANTNKRDNRKGIVLIIVTLLLLALIGGTVTYLVLNGKNSKSGNGGDGNTDDNTASLATKAPDSTTAPVTTKAPDATAAPDNTEEPDATTVPDTTKEPDATAGPETPPVFKLGVILLHDEQSAYDNNFIIALKAAQTELGLTGEQIVIKRNVDESNECYTAARELVAEGCTVIFANSYGHEDFLITAAKEFPEVQFCHATGIKAHTVKLANYHNAYAAIYDGRYLSGIAAGLKLKKMMSLDPGIVPKVGFVGALEYAEVISSYTAFYLGVKEIVPEATMEVQFTGSWYDEAKEKNAAEYLIGRGCVIISQYAESKGAPEACEAAGVPNVAYGSFNMLSFPKTFLIGSRINWAPYFEYLYTQVTGGGTIGNDWVGTLANGAVELSMVNNAFGDPNASVMYEQYRTKLKEGTLHVFDTGKFTVDGLQLTSYMADVDADNNYAPDTEAVSNGYFHESEYRSAPYFDIKAIDGITLLNSAY